MPSGKHPRVDASPVHGLIIGAGRGAVSQVPVMGAQLPLCRRGTLTVPAQALLLRDGHSWQVQVPCDRGVLGESGCVHHAPRDAAQGLDLSTRHAAQHTRADVNAPARVWRSDGRRTQLGRSRANAATHLASVTHEAACGMGAYLRNLEATFRGRPVFVLL